MSNKPPAGPAIPPDSKVLGFGPMLPLVAAAAAAWSMSPSWAALATALAIIWGALILAFVGGVRRGFGFGKAGASPSTEIAAAILYFVAAGVALVAQVERLDSIALAALAVGFYLVIVLDCQAAKSGNAPAYFRKLRPPQMALAIVSLVLLLAHELR